MLSSNLDKRGLSRRLYYTGIYWAIKDVLRVETSELILWLLSPRQTVEVRMFVVNAIMSIANFKNVLPHLLQVSGQTENKFIVYLWELIYNNELDCRDSKICEELKECIQQWGIVSSDVIIKNISSWKEKCSNFLREAELQMNAWKKQREMVTIKCVTKYDNLIKGMSEDAEAITRMVVNQQNTERKAFIEEIKRRYSENIQISVKWGDLIENMTHEKALWYFEKSYPMFWELDPTEGPARIRKRMRRCHLGIGERYLLPSQRYKLNNENKRKPLQFLFKNQKRTCKSVVLIEKLQCNEKIRVMYSAKVVTPAIEISGEILIGKTCIYFVADDSIEPSTDSSTTAWLFEDIKEIYSRMYELQEKAVEIFLTNGKTYFLAFDNHKERDNLIMELNNCHLPNRIAAVNLIDVMQLWREGLITNWEYLTHLNKLAGRSYNDLMQYPVYPFVLSDYSSNQLDLNYPGSYRNFKKPMAVQDKKNEEHYINNYNELLGGLKQVSFNKEPYHYGSHYSNSGTVLHFLVRVPPFTKMLLQYQDSNFDLPDRTFHSLHTTWKLASSESTTDVKEMIPEFFFLPEFLSNFQGFNFGTRQNGEIVNDVFLPPWCKGDPRKFIFIHRQALESDYVTENLPHWIDLVFGFKQTGKAAIEAINVFHPATYSGFNLECIADPVERTAWETMVKTYGQTPKQLLKTAHPFVVQSLVSELNSHRPVDIIDEVRGLKWGSYVGSPAEPEPVVVLKQQSKGKETIAFLVPLSTNDVLGIPPLCTSLVLYEREKGLGLVNAPGIRAAMVSWGYTDSIIRLKLKKEIPSLPLIYVPNFDPVTICVSLPGCNHLWIGHSSGNITVYKYRFIENRESIEFFENPITITGHKNSVTNIVICRPYSIAVSAGEDGVVIIWDLNTVSYVRSVNLREDSLKVVTVSDSSGDIASVTQGNGSSRLYLHSINASLVAFVPVKEIVSALCFSCAPEGISINVIACGLHTGTIRLFSSWDLTWLRDISTSLSTQSVISLVYSHDSQLLYACFRDGTVTVWENSTNKFAAKTSKFLTLKLD